MNIATNSKLINYKITNIKFPHVIYYKMRKRKNFEIIDSKKKLEKLLRSTTKRLLINDTGYSKKHLFLYICGHLKN